MAKGFRNIPNSSFPSVAVFADLPAAGAADGDVYLVRDVDALYAYDQPTLSWIQLTSSGGSGLTGETLAQNAIIVGNASSESAAVDTDSAGDILANTTTGLTYKAGSIDNADINAAAAIDATKIADGSVSNTEFQYINSVTSNVQDQLDNLSNLIPQLQGPVTLNDASTAVALSFPKTDRFAAISYSVQRDGKFRTGRLLVVNDDATANSQDDFVESGLTQVSFVAVISGANVEVQYTTAATGFNGTFKYKLDKWS